jgi:hypothetical protein
MKSKLPYGSESTMGQQHDTTHIPASEPEVDEPWLVTTAQELASSYSGAVHVQAHFVIAQEGLHYGPLCFEAGSTGQVVGEHLGPLVLGEGASVEIQGHHNGPVEIGLDAVVKVLPGGRLSGSLKVAGLVENHGVRAGNTVLAGGELHDIEGGTVEAPVITRSVTPS